MFKINSLIGFGKSSHKNNFYTDAPISNGLKLFFDASRQDSYPRDGSIGYAAGEDGVTELKMENVSYTTNGGGGVVFGSSSLVYGKLPDNSLAYNANSFTLSVWFRHTGTVSTARVQRYVTMHTQASEGPVIRHNNTSAASAHGFLFDNSSTYRSLDVASQIVTGNYYNLVFRYNGSNLRLYKNDVQIGSAAITITLDELIGTFRFGDNSTEYFEGELFIVQYFNRSLPTADMTTIYNTYKGRFGL